MNKVTQKQQTEGNDQNIVPSRALALRGRLISRHPERSISGMDLSHRITLNFALACGFENVSMQDLQRVLPTPFIKLVDNVSSFFKLIPYEEREGAYEKLEAALQNQCHLFIEKRRQFYLEAGVSDEKGLKAKKEQIDECKQKGRLCYFLEMGAIERKREIDEKMLAFSTLNFKDHAQTIKLYWDMIEGSPNGYAIHNELENRLFLIFVEHFLEIINIPSNSDEKEPPKKREIAQQVIENLHKRMQDTMHRLQVEQASAANEDEALQLQYLITKGMLIGPSLAKAMIRMVCVPLLESLEEEVNTVWVPFVKRQQEADVLYFQNEIDKAHEEIKGLEEEMAKKNNDALHCIFELKQIEIHNAYVQDNQKFLDECKDTYAFACYIATEDPRELAPLIPELTHYDQIILQLFPLDKDIKEQADLSINLSDLENPMDYFARRYRKQDAEVLALLRKDSDRFTEL